MNHITIILCVSGWIVTLFFASRTLRLTEEIQDARDENRYLEEELGLAMDANLDERVRILVQHKSKVTASKIVDLILGTKEVPLKAGLVAQVHQEILRTFDPDSSIDHIELGYQIELGVKVK